MIGAIDCEPFKAVFVKSGVFKYFKLWCNSCDCGGPPHFKIAAATKEANQSGEYLSY